MLVLVFLSVSAHAQENPPLPYIDEGACPFECCTYREWKANDTVVAYSEPKDGSSVAFIIKVGASVQAETGFVVTSKAGITEVLKPTKLGYPRDSAEPSEDPVLDLKPGELLYTLHYLGEGFDLFWYKGKLYSDQISGDKPDADPPPDLNLQIRSLPDQIWWVKVKTTTGQVGWIKNPPYFDGADSCA